MPLLDLPDDLLSRITLDFVGHAVAPATARICHRLASVVRCPRHWTAVFLFFTQPEEVPAFGYPKLLASTTTLSVAVDWFNEEFHDSLLLSLLSSLWLTQLLTLCPQLEDLSIAGLELSCCWLVTCAPLMTVRLSHMPMLKAVRLRNPSSVGVVGCPRLEKINAIATADLRCLELEVTNLDAQALQSLLVGATLLQSLTLRDQGDVEDENTSDDREDDSDDSDDAGTLRTISRNPDRIKLTYEFFKFICTACPNLSKIHISSSDARSGHPDLAAFLGHKALRHIKWYGGATLLPGHPRHDQLLEAKGVFPQLETLTIDGYYPNEYPMRDWGEKCPNIKLVEIIFPGMVGNNWSPTSPEFHGCAHLTHEYTTRFRTVLSAFDCSNCYGDGSSIHMKLRMDAWREKWRLELKHGKEHTSRIIGVQHSVKRDGNWDYRGCVSCPIHVPLSDDDRSQLSRASWLGMSSMARRVPGVRDST